MKVYKYKVKGAEYEVKINDVEGNVAKVEVNGITFEVETDRPMSPHHTPVVPQHRLQPQLRNQFRPEMV